MRIHSAGGSLLYHVLLGQRFGRNLLRPRGFTLLELMFTLAIVAVLAVIAIPTYQGVRERLLVGGVKKDLLVIAQQIERYKLPHDGKLPDSLSQLRGIPTLDAWGNPYQYLNFNPSDPSFAGRQRKDHNLHPINTQFDLYSMGADGESRTPLTAQVSRDDIVWARDGAFLGKAEDF